jgi:hypothetical protein
MFVSYDAKTQMISFQVTLEEQILNLHRHRHRNYQMPHYFLVPAQKGVVRHSQPVEGLEMVNVQDPSFSDWELGSAPKQ